MTQNSTVLSGIQLDQFMDRLEVEHQEHGVDYLLGQLRGQPLKATSLDSIGRLHALWVNAGDAGAARAVLADDGQALIEATPDDERNELKVNLLIYQLRLGNYFKDEQGLLQALDHLQQLTNEPLPFDIERREVRFTRSRRRNEERTGLVSAMEHGESLERAFLHLIRLDARKAR